MSSESSYVPLPESAPRRRWLAVACASAGAVAVVALARPGALVASSASLAREDSDWAPTPRPSWHQDDDRIWVSFKPTAPDGTPTPAPTPRPSAPVDADDDYDDDAARTTRHNKLMVPKLMGAWERRFQRRFCGPPCGCNKPSPAGDPPVTQNSSSPPGSLSWLGFLQLPTFATARESRTKRGVSALLFSFWSKEPGDARVVIDRHI